MHRLATVHAGGWGRVETSGGLGGKSLKFGTSHTNPLDSKGNHSATSDNTKLEVHWPLMGGLLHLVQRGGVWAGWGHTQSPPHSTKCNSPPINGQCTNHCIAT